jgi:hypothetical protein
MRFFPLKRYPAINVGFSTFVHTFLSVITFYLEKGIAKFRGYKVSVYTSVREKKRERERERVRGGEGGVMEGGGRGVFAVS